MSEDQQDTKFIGMAIISCLAILVALIFTFAIRAMYQNSKIEYLDWEGECPEDIDLLPAIGHYDHCIG